MFKKTLRVIQKETSLRPRNRNQYLYVRSIGLGCWGTCPTATQGGEGCLIKFPGLLWTSSARTAWRRPRWIVYPSEFFLGDQKWHNCREREIWTVWRVIENLRLYWLSAVVCREGNEFLGWGVAGDESWCHHFEPELKRQSLQWKHLGSPPSLKNPKPSTQVQERLCCRSSLTKTVSDRFPAAQENSECPV